MADLVMLLGLQNVLTADEIKILREIGAAGQFSDGALSAPGLGATGVKRNEQLTLKTEDHERMVQLVLGALDRNETFRTAAVPKLIYPPILSRYRKGMAYGTHIDNPIRRRPQVLRLDLSITIFLNDPGSYVGGELVVETPYGEKQAKMPAGDAILYPTTMLHRVAEVKEGERLAAVTWIQSMVREQDKRTLLYELAQITQWASQVAPDSAPYHKLNNTRANLIRMWATD
jgi:PKHD-type hydroxylase